LIPLEVLGLLIPLALAAGVDLYLTLVLLGIAGLTGWGGAHAGSLGELGTPLIVGMAFAFYLLEFMVERVGAVSLFWNSAHALIRPLAASLLLLLASPGLSPGGTLLLLALGGAVAFAGHGVRFGSRLLLRLTADRPPSFLLLSLAEDAVTLGLVALALDLPAVAGALALLFLMAGLTVGAPLIRASLFGLGLARGVVASLLKAGGWREPSGFPRWVAGPVRGDDLAPGGGLRGTPAGIRRGRRKGLFHSGWLVVTGGAPVFLFRHLGRTRALRLERERDCRVVSRSFFNRVDISGESGERISLVLPRTGPGRESLKAEFLVGESTGLKPGGRIPPS